mmetsp:Transcript_15322/g.41964  ORF Transcript_15322/g.41964 Transcript_15322/m.41964 type:complete len:134 (-) Transcript_15322:91-492(-)
MEPSSETTCDGRVGGLVFWSQRRPGLLGSTVPEEETEGLRVCQAQFTCGARLPAAIGGGLRATQPFRLQGQSLESMDSGKASCGDAAIARSCTQEFAMQPFFITLSETEFELSARLPPSSSAPSWRPLWRRFV